MNESQPSPVVLVHNSDTAMQRAYLQARATFRYFWREIAWERRRIIPGLDLAAIKAPFVDDPNGDLEAEHMWIEQVDFDGRCLSGLLLNAPNSLESFKIGDPVRLSIEEISDWMYVIGGEVYGAYTVNLIRSRMGVRERQEHDAAWGLSFGDPHEVRIVPEPKKAGGLLARLSSGDNNVEAQEHPMSENTAAAWQKQLQENPSSLNWQDENGWTLLHHQALAGSAATVKILLEAGANKEAVTDLGMTPLQLADSLGWDKVMALLK
jgi:uncharacterized protein